MMILKFNYEDVLKHVHIQCRTDIPSCTVYMYLMSHKRQGLLTNDREDVDGRG